jgi:phage head maturation protease
MEETAETREALPRPLRDNIERSLARFEVSDDEELPKLTGHLAVFDQWTRISSMFEGEFMERIAPGASLKTIKENRDRIQITFNHGHDPSLGDQVLADLRDIGEDDIGTYYDADLFPEIPPLLMRGLRHGKYGASFRFSVVKEEPVRWWEKRPTKESEHNPDRLPERTIRELALYEFGPVTYPAYAGATSAVRSTTDYYMSQRLTGDPERLLKLIQANALTDDGAEAEPHSEPASRVIAVPPPTRKFASREEFIRWTQSRT